MKYDPHGKAQALRSMLEKLRVKRQDICDENRTLILDFYRELATDNLSVQRIYKYMETIGRIAKKVKKSLDEMTKADIKEFVIGIDSDPNYSNWTKHDYKCALRRFYKWRRGGNKIFPEDVSWIKIHMRNQHKLPEELLSDEEVNKMISVAGAPRERALIHCLFESGCRISEVLTIQIKNIKFDEFGAVVIVTGKTGDRRIRLIASVPALATWLEMSIKPE